MTIRPLRNFHCIVLAVYLLTGFCTDLRASELRNTSVFILHSYSQEYPWTKRQHDGFIQRLGTATPGGSTICVEYLDTKRLPYTDAYAGLMADYLERRYASFHPDLIYVTDDNALVFALSHLSRIFPSSPIFFSGVNNYEIKPLLPKERVTGVFERKEVAPNLALLAHLTPPAKELLAVGDSSETYLAIQREIEIELQRHRGIHVRFVANKQIEPMLETLRGCPERYLFLTTMGGMKDSTGRVMTLQETIASVVGAGSFVVISMEDAYLFPGVLGGWVTSGKKQGESTADLVARYLSGAPIAEISPIEQSPNEYVFEDYERERIGLTLPAEVASRATILNPLPTFYQRHAHIIGPTLYALIILIVALLGLFLHLANRKRAEESRRQLQESLEKTQRMESLGILAGGVAHDLNNTLGPIVGYSELLMREFPEESKAAAKLGKINKSAHDAAVVIQDLLTLARRGRLEMKPTDLKGVIQGFIDSPTFEEAKARNRNIVVKLNLSPSIGLIQGSEPHLEKAVMNLVLNAFEAMPSGGTLTISTEQLFLEKLLSGERNIKSGDYALLRVRDTGCGISEEDIERIFEPYFSKKKMGRSGSGLGLSVVYGVVKDHHGYYDIISEVNKGTEFILYFPVSVQEKPSSQPVRAEAKRGNETILIVDDDADQREMAREIVSSYGYTVHVAENGHRAVEFLSRNHADLILLDMIMEPDFDGLDTYREILKIDPHQKAIVVSGYSATVRVQKVLELGASCYVRKPYGIETLTMAIRASLDSVASLTAS